MSFNNPNHDGPADQNTQSGMDKTKAQVDEVVVIMKQNVDKGNTVIAYNSLVNFRYL